MRPKKKINTTNNWARVWKPWRERERKKNKGEQRGQRVVVVFCFRSFYGINECADKAELSKLRGSVLQLRVLFEQDV